MIGANHDAYDAAAHYVLTGDWPAWPGAATCSCSAPGGAGGCAGSRPARWRAPAPAAPGARW